MPIHKKRHSRDKGNDADGALATALPLPAEYGSKHAETPENRVAEETLLRIDRVYQ